MEFEKIISDLKNRVYHPVYFLMGKESYYIDQVSDCIEETVLNDSEKEFNQSVLYGGDTNLDMVLAEAKSYPMMSNYRVVIVKEAQNLKGLLPKVNKQKKDDSENNEKKNPLELYLDNPQKTTLLVFCFKHGSIDMRTSFAKKLSKKAVMLNSELIRDYNIATWVAKFIQSRGFGCEPSVGDLLADYLGNDLGKIANELEKLFLNLPPKTKITSGHIQTYIGISKDYNIFELQNALAKRESSKANQIVKHFAANEKDHLMLMTTAGLFSYFNKLLIFHSLSDRSPKNVAAALKINPFFVKEYSLAALNYPVGKVMKIISLLREYDMKGKGVDSPHIPHGELHKELVAKILA